MKTTELTLNAKLVTEARERLAQERELDLEIYIEMHLRMLLRSKNTLNLMDTMPFGKFSGEIVENVCRADPGYMAWLIAQGGKTNFDANVLSLVDSLIKVS